MILASGPQGRPRFSHRTQQAARGRMRTPTVQFRGQMVTGGARRIPDRVDALGNRYYRIVTVGDFLMRFSRELWDFLQDTNPVARRCVQIALGRPSEIAAMVHVSTLPPAAGQHRVAFPEYNFRLSPKVPSASQPFRPITGSTDNAGIETKIRCLQKRKAPALGRRLEIPVDDPEAPSPLEGSICCGK